MSQTPSLENATCSSKPPKLLDQVVERLRVKHYSKRTEQAYVHWIKHSIFFHGKRHSRAMGAGEVETFLSMLATQRNVAAATQNQALAAILVPGGIGCGFALAE